MRRVIRLLCLLSLFSLFASFSWARHHFRRVYRGSRVIRIRQGHRTKKVPTNTYYSKYDERRLRTLPMWPPRKRGVNKALRYIWLVRDHNTDLDTRPDSRRVGSRRSNPRRVRAVGVLDFTDVNND